MLKNGASVSCSSETNHWISYNNISGFSSEWNYFCICKAKFDQIPTGREAGTQTVLLFVGLFKQIKPYFHCDRLTATTGFQQC